MCGATKHMKPIVPVKLIIDAVKNADTNITKILSLSGFTPKLFATSSPAIIITLTSQAFHINRIKPITSDVDITGSIFHVAFPKSPTIQK